MTEFVKEKKLMPVSANPTHCYLCGRPLSNPISKDHCPPQSLFAEEIRQQHNIDQLLTIPVHEKCNASFSRDEEYFIATMIPFAPGSVAGDAVFRQFMVGSKKNQNKWRLAGKVLNEFEIRPSGLYLPPRKVAKRQEGNRITRIAWKVVRGLYFTHFDKKILPESLPINCEFVPPNERPPEHFLHVSSLPNDASYGQYPGVFDYRFRIIETDLGKLNYWAFLIWDRIIITVYSHDPWSCPCVDCTVAVAEMEMRVQEEDAEVEKLLE